LLIMAELDRMIAECAQWKQFHVAQRNAGVRGAAIEALACDIRLTALRDAKQAIEKQ
jgi:hypothetical protein